MKSQPDSRDPAYYDNGILNELCGRVSERLDDLFAKLGVRLMQAGRRYVGRCPVHGGRSPFGLNFYPDGERAKGVWICNSDHCHEHFKKSTVGFARGVLSHDTYGWEKPGDRMVSHEVAVNCLLDLLGLKISDIKADAARDAARRFADDVEYLTFRPPADPIGIWTRPQFRKIVTIPSAYYMDRGYTPEILDEYDVGLCHDADSEMCGRVVVPFYDPDNRRVVGCVGRSVHPRCSLCHLHHRTTSPCPGEADADLRDSAKWLAFGGFNDKNTLYNYWRSSPSVKESLCVVLVEGAGDVWRFREAGVDNVVALMGSHLSESQSWLLESCGASTFVVVTDSDEAGRKAWVQISKRCGHLGTFCRHELPPDAKDVGEMSVDDVREHVVPYIRSRMRVKKKEKKDGGAGKRRCIPPWTQMR